MSGIATSPPVFGSRPSVATEVGVTDTVVGSSWSTDVSLALVLLAAVVVGSALDATEVVVAAVVVGSADVLVSSTDVVVTSSVVGTLSSVDGTLPSGSQSLDAY